MLSSPVRRGTPTAAFGAGLVAGGCLTATALLVVGSLVRAPLPQPARWAVVAAALGALLLVEWGGWAVRVPQNRRLVPESVFRFGRHLGPLQFGLEMGTGARTYLPSALPYAAATAVALLASPAAALCAGAGFGLGRALMTAAAVRYPGPDGDEHGRAWSDEWSRHAGRLAVLTSAAVVAALAAVAVAG
ncbi:MAG TPA: hypothetical protein VMU51_10385 [Mycobacteriales bacterium]|nr:hypothetical protein [Mycobacteriales bacterium]